MADLGDAFDVYFCLLLCPMKVSVILFAEFCGIFLDLGLGTRAHMEISS